MAWQFTHARGWGEMAVLDPLWAIASTPTLRYGGWDDEAFMARGKRKANRLIRWLRELDEPVRLGRALDFGCGVGRVSIPLAKHFEEVVGVDVADGMIVQANERAAAARHRNVRFLLNTTDDLSMLRRDQFDLVYTSLVLQHLGSRSTITRYTRQLAQLVGPGGALIAQVPRSLRAGSRLQLAPRIYASGRRLGLPPKALYARLRLHPIRMQAYPRHRFEQLLQAEGLRVVRVVERETGVGVGCTYHAVRSR
jgi:SAM-dependent methyltransferase